MKEEQERFVVDYYTFQAEYVIISTFYFFNSVCVVVKRCHTVQIVHVISKMLKNK